MRKSSLVAILAIQLSVTALALSDDGSAGPASRPSDVIGTPSTGVSGDSTNFLTHSIEMAAANPSSSAPAAQAASAAKGPPLPLHTIDGVGGILITPTAYLVNPGPQGAIFGLPAASTTYVNAGSKNIEDFAVTETLWRRIELGYSLSRFGLGSLPHDIYRDTGVDLDRDDVYLHVFNARGLLLEENSFGTTFLPAVTAGVQFKVNDGISSINSQLGGALSSIGYEKSNGVDYTLTASKTLPFLLNRPLIVSGGLRLSEAAQTGYLGFGDEYRASFEGNAAWLLTDHIALAYEFRQKHDPYGRIPGLVGAEDNWQTVGVGIIFNEHLTLTAGWGYFGNVLNSVEDGGWALSLKYEF